MKRVLLFLALLLMFIPLKADAAAKKVVDVDVPKDYKDCTFSIDFDDPGDYSAKLIDPEGAKYKFQKIDDTKMTVSVSDVFEGKWKVKIKSEAADPIGHVKVSLSASASAKTDIVDNISVAKDISGLVTYLKNKSVVVEWTDDSVENVNIKVTNLDTQETIASETVSEKKYECPVDDAVRNVSVSVVPSQSEGVDGAEKVFKFSMDSFPTAEVTYPDFTSTKENFITVTVTLDDDYETMVYDNDRVIMEKQAFEKGSYKYEIPIEDEGVNDIELFVIGKDGNMKSYDAQIIKDVTAPELTLTEEYDGMTTSEQQFVISGKVTDYTAMRVNDETITPSTDGYFEYTLNLHDGENAIKLEAEDEAGNLAEYSMTIVKTQASKGLDSSDIILIVITLVGGVGAYFYIKNSSAKKKEAPPEKPSYFSGAQSDDSMKTSMDSDGGLPRIVLPSQKTGSKFKRKNR